MSQPSASTTSTSANPSVNTSDAPTENDERPEPINFTLIVLSPSLGADRSLSFPHLPATTSIKELKAKIRDALPTKPADEGQRLIHRGRMLARDTDTMADIFGRETLASPETQTLHLVLRPNVTDQLPSNHVPAPLVGPQRVATPGTPQFQARPQPTPTILDQAMPTPQNLPGIHHVHQHQYLHQADHLQSVMAQRLFQLQQETTRLQQEMISVEQRSRAIDAHRARALQEAAAAGLDPQSLIPPLLQPPSHPMPTSIQNLLNQQQRSRAAEGRQGVQEGHQAPNVTGSASGRSSPGQHPPEHTTTQIRHGISPNGDRWQVTVNETVTTYPSGQQPLLPQQIHQPQFVPHNPANPAENVNSILRNADRMLAARTLQNNMQQIAATGQPVNPTPTTQPIGSGPSDALPGTPNLMTNANSRSVLPGQVPNAGPSATTSSNSTNPPNSNPMVYLLSSPQGPRALVLSNSETFYTPRAPSRRRRHDSPIPAQGQGQPAAGRPVMGEGALPALNALVEAQRRENRNHAGQNGGNAAAPLAGNANANPAPGQQLGPMLWLVVRLAVFVWFFTSGNSSWIRFSMIVAVALGVFIYNTGLLNGAAEQLWGPIRRHVETLIPLAGPDAALIPAANALGPRRRGQPGMPAENAPAPDRRPGELDPAVVAARLVNQHRDANAGWLVAQIRRAEHAALLFLASLVPGVGERHIAAREAEAAAAETAEQRRIEAAAERDESAEGRIAGEQGGENHEQNQPPAVVNDEVPPLIQV